MNLWDSIQVALEGLAANKLRSALTMLGIIIGVGAVIGMLAIASGARAQMMNSIQGMGTNVLFVFPGAPQRGGGPARGGMGSVQTLTLEDADAVLKQCSSVEKVAPEVAGNAQVKYKNANANTQVNGSTPDFLSVRNFRMAKGRFYNAGEVRASAKVAVIGPTTAKELFGERQTPVGKDIRIKGIRFRVVGLMASKGSQGGFGDPDDAVYIPITTAMRRVFGLEKIRSISVQAKSMDLIETVKTEITTVLHKRHRLAAGEEDDFGIFTQSDMMQMANSMSATMTALLGGIAGVSLLVGGIGIMNIMLVSVTERTREIGIRKALGARKRDILAQFMVEAMVLSLCGGALGILLGFALSSVATLLNITPVVTSLSIILAFSFAAAVGIVFGIYPAIKAAQLDPIDALRYE